MDEYITQFAEVVKDSKDLSTEVLTGVLTYEQGTSQISGSILLQALELPSSSPQTRSNIQSNPDLGLSSPHPKKIILEPVRDLPSALLRRNYDPNRLKHFGYLIGDQYNNLQNVVNFGVFGKSDIQQPTFLSVLSSEVKPNSKFGATRSQSVLIHIDYLHF